MKLTKAQIKTHQEVMALIELGSRLAHYGTFIIPQMSSPFSFSGKQFFTEKANDKCKKFIDQTGILMEMNCGIDTAIYKDDWKGVSPICEIVVCEFEQEKEEAEQQLSLFEVAA